MAGSYIGLCLYVVNSAGRAGTRGGDVSPWLGRRGGRESVAGMRGGGRESVAGMQRGGM